MQRTILNDSSITLKLIYSINLCIKIYKYIWKIQFSRINLFYVQERSFLNFRKPTPVTIPDKGSHYLKKSPSPTGHKSPPGSEGGGDGVTLSPVNEYLQRKALITTNQQVRNHLKNVVRTGHVRQGGGGRLQEKGASHFIYISLFSWNFYL